MSDCTCGFCGRGFQPDDAQPTCAACPLNGGCQLVRCPHCGYENPLTPGWLLKVRAWLGSADTQDREAPWR